MRRKRYDVCAVVVSDLPYDARGEKEVKALSPSWMLSGTGGMRMTSITRAGGLRTESM